MNFRTRSKPEAIAFQIAPMIDFLVVLLCYTLATQIFNQWESEFDVSLPTAKSAEMTQRLPGEIIINVLRDGQVVVNQKPLTATELSSLLNRIVGMFPGQPVLVRADKETAYQHVVKVLDACRMADIWNIAFATISVEEAPPR